MVSLSQGLVVTAGGVGLDSATQMVEEASRKRELRLLKNKYDLFHFVITFPGAVH